MTEGFVRPFEACHVRPVRGFTLVELMVTVSIVGVLAVVAYTGYQKYLTSSHNLEAANILAGIKNREEDYKAETGAYLKDTAPTLAANQNPGNFGALFPMCTAGGHLPGKEKVAWPSGGGCSESCCPPWQKLRVNSTAPTYYGFSFTAGSGATGIPAISMGTNAAVLPTSPVGPWFVATAIGDTNGNGVYTTSMISSFDNEIHVDEESE